MLTNGVYRRLYDIFGMEGFRTKNLEDYTIDGNVPKSMVVPRSFDQVVEVMKFASSENLKVFPYGGGTSMGVGLPPEQYDLVINLQKLDRVLEFVPDDMTCSVQSGITVHELNHILSEKDLFIPLDPPLPKQATIGGITASNMNGPLRQQYGGVKDQILGMQMISSDGTVVKSGGKVVKNVAGYDVHKLFIGSFGTLGIISQVNFKLRPVPPVKKTVILGFDSILSAIDTIKALLDSFIMPEFLVLCCKGTMKVLAEKSHLSIPDQTTGLIIGVDNHPENTQWQIEEIQHLVAGISIKCMYVIENEQQSILRRSFRDYPVTFNPELIVRVTFLLSHYPELYQMQKQLQEKLHHPAYLLVNPGCGTMHLLFDSINRLEGKDKDNYVDFLSELADLTERLEGSLVVEKAPLWIKNRISIWGKQREDFLLMNSIKKELDPLNILSPGRFMDEL
ncbi:MAG: FAD-binding oxidoreductase [Patescibacteria group bacterium]|nr:FAD-binding oxidoreductase [Patescibacteria group bacterium]